MFVQIAKILQISRYIFSNCKIYLFKLQDIFVQIARYICVLDLIVSSVALGGRWRLKQPGARSPPFYTDQTGSHLNGVSQIYLFN